MRIFKKNPLLKLVNSYLVDSPQPANLNYWWNFGSLLALSLGIQIITGVTLAMHYNSSLDDAFDSVEHIMRDINNGWLIRYLHSNTASAFFFVVYLHIGRGLYYGSYKTPRTLVWALGTIIFIIMMATAFLGYVLPFGQMSLWGATVITSLMSAIPWIGQEIVQFIWGGFSVNGATLNRFFALHFLLPFTLAALALSHLISLHDRTGSGNPLGVSSSSDKLPFAPYFIFKDLITIFIYILVLSVFVFYMPNVLGDSENYVMADPMKTPAAIVPEWYLLSFYAILRSIPNKLLGVIAMFSAILMLVVLSALDWSRSRGLQFKPLGKVTFFLFVGNFIMLTKLGAEHVEFPFIELGQLCTLVYFSYFLVIVPGISETENSVCQSWTARGESLVAALSVLSKENIAKPARSAEVKGFGWKLPNLPKLPNLNDLPGVRNLPSLPALPSLPVLPGLIGLGAVGFTSTINSIRWYSPSLSSALCDAPRPWGFYFQDAGTPQMEAIGELHNNIMYYLIAILLGVAWLLRTIIRKYNSNVSPLSKKFSGHGTSIEVIWTVTPALILILLAIPSFKLLYLIDEVIDPNMVIYAEGHQWYWSYQFADFINDDSEHIEYDSYLIPELDLVNGALRMLDVDHRVSVPELTHIRFVVAGGDVIHSFACPSLGLKCDAYPGRLSQSSLLLNRASTFYGQCSEICGILHSAMPIVFEALSIERFLTWLKGDEDSLSLLLLIQTIVNITIDALQPYIDYMISLWSGIEQEYEIFTDNLPEYIDYYVNAFHININYATILAHKGFEYFTNLYNQYLTYLYDQYLTDLYNQNFKDYFYNEVFNDIYNNIVSIIKHYDQSHYLNTTMYDTNTEFDDLNSYEFDLIGMHTSFSIPVGEDSTTGASGTQGNAGEAGGSAPGNVGPNNEPEGVDGQPYRDPQWVLDKTDEFMSDLTPSVENEIYTDKAHLLEPLPAHEVVNATSAQVGETYYDRLENLRQVATEADEFNKYPADERSPSGLTVKEVADKVRSDINKEQN